MPRKPVYNVRSKAGRRVMLKRLRVGKKKRNKNIGSSRLIQFAPTNRLLYRSVVPPRYRTKLHCYYAVTGDANGMSGGTFDVAGVPYIPFSKAGSVNFREITAATFFGATPINGVVVGNWSCPGYDKLCAQEGLYNRYRVLATKCEVTFMPRPAVAHSQGMQFYASLAAWYSMEETYSQIATAGQGPMTVGPITCSQYNSNRQNTLKMFVKNRDLFGVTAHAMESQTALSASYNSRPFHFFGYRFLCQTTDAANGAAGDTIQCQVKLTMYVEFNAADTGGLKDTVIGVTDPEYGATGPSADIPTKIS